MRVTCEHAAECSGCPLIDLDYGDQLDAKRHRVAEAIAPYPSLRDVTIFPTAEANPVTAYRTRAKLMVASTPGGGPPRLGLFTASHQVVDIPGCRVLSPAVERTAAQLRELLRAPLAAAGPCLLPVAGGGLLAAFDLRSVVDDDERVLVTLVLEGNEVPRDDELEAAAEALSAACPAVLGIAANFRSPGSVQVLGPATRVLRGPRTARDRGRSSYHLAAYGSFTQNHRGQAARIEEWIAERLDGARAILDLYGGSGALSLPLAARGRKVTLVESFVPAAECAREAARQQNIADYVVHAANAETLAELARSTQFDAIIANPPRRGIAPVARKAMAALSPDRIVYVSCDPDTLARDLDHLARLGYRVHDLLPVDMIPLTDQVETVAFLERRAATRPHVAYADDDICVVEKYAHEPPGYPSSPVREARLIWRVSTAASGLAVWSDNAFATPRLRASLAAPDSAKVHLALARGITAAEGTIKGGTSYRRVAKLAGHSLLRVTADETQGAHIERDLARIGHPVIGDARHGHTPTNRHFAEKYGLDRPFLHCVVLRFAHPRTADMLEVRGTLPGELVMVLRRLGGAEWVDLDVVKEVMVG